MARVEIIVDKAKLINAINKVESEKEFGNLNSMHKAACEEYNKNKGDDLDEITPALVMLRILKWDISCKTVAGKKGRGETEVDRDKLIAAITKAENNKKYDNLNALYKDVAEIYNSSQPPEEISFSVVGLRIAKWGIQVRTKPGRVVEVRRPTIQFKEKEEKSPSVEEVFEKEWAGGFALQINDKLRIARLDKRNWIVQSKKGDLWLKVSGYRSSFFSCILWIIMESGLSPEQASQTTCKELQETWQNITNQVLEGMKNALSEGLQPVTVKELEEDEDSQDIPQVA